jgi:hypothetical protein
MVFATKPYVGIAQIRPLTQVCQNIPVCVRPQKNSRAGSTRILTDTPEKLKIDEDHRRKTEKERKKEERKMRKLTPRNIMNPTTKEVARKQSKAKSPKDIPKENMANHLDEHIECPILIQPTSSLNKTRAGRLVKRRKVTDL